MHAHGNLCFTQSDLCTIHVSCIAPLSHIMTSTSHHHGLLEWFECPTRTCCGTAGVKKWVAWAATPSLAQRVENVTGRLGPNQPTNNPSFLQGLLQREWGKERVERLGLRFKSSVREDAFGGRGPRARLTQVAKPIRETRELSRYCGYSWAR